MINQVKKLFSSINNRQKNDKGATSIEYILIAAIVSIALIAGFINLRSVLNNKLSVMNDSVATGIV